jgi:hypothetical protein
MLLYDKENNFKYCDPGCKYGSGQQCHLQFNPGYSQGKITVLIAYFGQDYQNFVKSLFLKDRYLICHPANPKKPIQIRSKRRAKICTKNVYITGFFLFVGGLECVGHIACVVHFVFLGDV